jgi:NitT/TauT family transport system ATP-binding protein
MASIAVDDVSKHFISRAHATHLPVLQNISFTGENGQFICLLGRSGCGKSTLLALISGLDEEFNGKITFDAVTVAERQNAGVRLGFVFQSPRLLPWKNVRDNLLFVLRRSGLQDWRERADLWLDRVGLKEFANAYPHELSGGMQQRVSLARAFAVDPDILLMDEPFSGLDEFTGRAMRTELLDLWQQTGKTVLFVTHNCFEACFLANRVIVLGGRPGKIVWDAPIELDHPRDYEDPDLFRLSVKLTHVVMESAA